MRNPIYRFFVDSPFQSLSHSDSSFIRSIYVLFHPFVIASTFVYFLISTPLDMAFSVEIWGDGYADFVYRYAKAGNSPQIFIAFFSVYPITAPLTVLTIIHRMIFSEHKYWYSRWITKTFSWQIGILVWLALIGIVTLLGMFIPGDPSFCSGGTTRSYFGLVAIYGYGLPIGLSLVIAGIITLAANIFESLNCGGVGKYYG